MSPLRYKHLTKRIRAKAKWRCQGRVKVVRREATKIPSTSRTETAATLHGVRRPLIESPAAAADWDSTGTGAGRRPATANDAITIIAIALQLSCVHWQQWQCQTKYAPLNNAYSNANRSRLSLRIVECVWTSHCICVHIFSGLQDKYVCYLRKTSNAMIFIISCDAGPACMDMQET